MYANKSEDVIASIVSDLESRKSESLLPAFLEMKEGGPSPEE